MSDITAEYLRSVLDYNPDTGEFTWTKTICPRMPAGKKAGCKDGRYLFVGLNFHKHLLHRLAWLHFYGEWPAGDIDHINGDRYDNSITNLRCVSHSENMRNFPLRLDNKTGAHGVHRRRDGKWYAQGWDNGKNKHLGVFDSFEDAARARRKFQREHGFHPNHGRAA